jgi:hypothetical protein
MTFTSPTDDIIVQEGTFGFDFTASGTIYKGQAVYANKSDLYVAAVPTAGGTTPQTRIVGLAAYDQTNGKPLTVFGPGNICRAITSGSCEAGDNLWAHSEGKLSKISGWPDLSAPVGSGVKFMALETADATDDTIKVLVY